MAATACSGLQRPKPRSQGSVSGSEVYEPEVVPSEIQRAAASAALVGLVGRFLRAPVCALRRPCLAQDPPEVIEIEHGGPRVRASGERQRMLGAWGGSGRNKLPSSFGGENPLHALLASLPALSPSPLLSVVWQAWPPKWSVFGKACTSASQSDASPSAAFWRIARSSRLEQRSGTGLGGGVWFWCGAALYTFS